MAKIKHQREIAAITHEENGHTISYTDRKGGFYWTYIGHGRNDRKRIQRKTREELLDYLFQYYKEEDDEDDPANVQEPAIGAVVPTTNAVPQSQMTLGEALDACIQNKHDRGTLEQSTVNRNHYTSAFFDGIKDRRIAELTTNDITSYIASQAPFTRRAVKDALQLLRTTYRWAVKKHLVTEDVTDDISVREFYKFVQEHEKSVGDKSYSPAEIANIKANAYKWARKNIRAYILLLATMTGMRAGELVALHWEDIYDGVIHVCRQQQTPEDENGKKLPPAELPYTKNERLNEHTGRDFPITSEIQALLDELWPITGGGTYVFADKNGEWITKDSYWKYLRRHIRSLGYTITKNHSFRMSLNNNELKGMDPNDKALVLGHSPETNIRYYSGDKRELVHEIGRHLEEASAANPTVRPQLVDCSPQLTTKKVI